MNFNTYGQYYYDYLINENNYINEFNLNFFNFLKKIF